DRPASSAAQPPAITPRAASLRPAAFGPYSRRMDPRHALRRLAMALAAVAALRARADDPAARGFDPDPPRPAIGLDGNFVVDTPGIEPARSYRAHFFLDYA